MAISISSRRVKNASTVETPPPYTPFMTAVSPNGRYFVDQYGAPFLVKGSSDWGALSDLSVAEWTTLMSSRAANGCNVTVVYLVSSSIDVTGNGDGSTRDGIFPFTGSFTPNNTYFNRLDSFLTVAASYGITVMLDVMPAYALHSGQGMAGITGAQANALGQYLATRYASTPNVTWFLGGDYQEWAAHTYDAPMLGVIAGLAAGGQERLWSVQLDYYRSLSSDASAFAAAPWRSVYTYPAAYDLVYEAWSASPTRPALYTEGPYEGGSTAHGEVTNDPLDITKQGGWSLTSGSAGDVYGSSDWGFGTGWASRLNGTGLVRLARIRAAIEAIRWWTLQPSLTFVTTGAGTRIDTTNTNSTGYPVSTDLVTAAISADGSNAAVYFPSNARGVTLNTAALAAGVAGTWLQVSTGTTSAATLTGTVTPPSSGDWLLTIQ